MFIRLTVCLGVEWLDRDLHSPWDVSFGIFATSDISRREEIVLPWDWDDQHTIHLLPRLLHHSNTFEVQQQQRSPALSPTRQSFLPWSMADLRLLSSKMASITLTLFGLTCCGCEKKRTCGINLMWKIGCLSAGSPFCSSYGGMDGESSTDHRGTLAMSNLKEKADIDLALLTFEEKFRVVLNSFLEQPNQNSSKAVRAAPSNFNVTNVNRLKKHKIDLGPLLGLRRDWWTASGVSHQPHLQTRLFPDDLTVTTKRARSGSSFSNTTTSSKVRRVSDTSEHLSSAVLPHPSTHDITDVLYAVEPEGRKESCPSITKPTDSQPVEGVVAHTSTPSPPALPPELQRMSKIEPAVEDVDLLRADGTDDKSFRLSAEDPQALRKANSIHARSVTQLPILTCDSGSNVREVEDLPMQPDVSDLSFRETPGNQSRVQDRGDVEDMPMPTDAGDLSYRRTPGNQLLVQGSDVEDLPMQTDVPDVSSREAPGNQSLIQGKINEGLSANVDTHEVHSVNDHNPPSPEEVHNCSNIAPDKAPAYTLSIETGLPLPVPNGMQSGVSSSSEDTTTEDSHALSITPPDIKNTTFSPVQLKQPAELEAGEIADADIVMQEETRTDERPELGTASEVEHQKVDSFETHPAEDFKSVEVFTHAPETVTSKASHIQAAVSPIPFHEKVEPVRESEAANSTVQPSFTAVELNDHLDGPRQMEIIEVEKEQKPFSYVSDDAHQIMESQALQQLEISDHLNSVNDQHAPIDEPVANQDSDHVIPVPLLPHIMHSHLHELPDADDDELPQMYTIEEPLGDSDELCLDSDASTMVLDSSDEEMLSSQTTRYLSNRKRNKGKNLLKPARMDVAGRQPKAVSPLAERKEEPHRSIAIHRGNQSHHSRPVKSSTAGKSAPKRKKAVTDDDDNINHVAMVRQAKNLASKPRRFIQSSSPVELERKTQAKKDSNRRRISPTPSLPSSSPAAPITANPSSLAEPSTVRLHDPCDSGSEPAIPPSVSDTLTSISPATQVSVDTMIQEETKTSQTAIQPDGSAAERAPFDKHRVPG